MNFLKIFFSGCRMLMHELGSSWYHEGCAAVSRLYVLSCLVLFQCSQIQSSIRSTYDDFKFRLGGSQRRVFATQNSTASTAPFSQNTTGDSSRRIYFANAPAPLHDRPSHPECAARANAIEAALLIGGLTPQALPNQARRAYRQWHTPTSLWLEGHIPRSVRIFLLQGHHMPLEQLTWAVQPVSKDSFNGEGTMLEKQMKGF